MYSQEKKLKVLEALEANGGNIHNSCLAEGISRGIYYVWMDDPTPLKKIKISAEGEEEQFIEFTFKDLAEAITEQSIDNVESSLYRKAIEGDTIAIIFYLKTKGKKRGYIERLETDITTNGKTINSGVDLTKLSDSALRELANASANESSE